MAYLSTLEDAKEELSKFDTHYDHMYYYFTEKLGISEDEAIRVVDDFKADFMKQE